MDYTFDKGFEFYDRKTKYFIHSVHKNDFPYECYPVRLSEIVKKPEGDLTYQESFEILTRKRTFSGETIFECVKDRLETIIYNLVDALDESLGRCDKSELKQVLLMGIGMTEEEVEIFAGDLLGKRRIDKMNRIVDGTYIMYFGNEVTLYVDCKVNLDTREVFETDWGGVQCQGYASQEEVGYENENGIYVTKLVKPIDEMDEEDDDNEDIYWYK